MQQPIKVIIDGTEAEAAAQQLLAEPDIQGQILKEDAIYRSLDHGVILEIMQRAGEIIGMSSGTVSLAYNLWKWRRELKQDKKVILSKEEGGKEKRLLLDEATTREAIEHFLDLN